MISSEHLWECVSQDPVRFLLYCLYPLRHHNHTARESSSGVVGTCGLQCYPAILTSKGLDRMDSRSCQARQSEQWVSWGMNHRGINCKAGRVLADRHFQVIRWVLARSVWDRSSDCSTCYGVGFLVESRPYYPVGCGWLDPPFVRPNRCKSSPWYPQTYSPEMRVETRNHYKGSRGQSFRLPSQTVQGTR